MESLALGRRLFVRNTPCSLPPLRGGTRFRTYPWGKSRQRRENAEGAKVPPWISPKKRPALKSQTEENATPPGEYNYEIIEGLSKLQRSRQKKTI